MTDQKMELALAVEKVKPSARTEKQPESAGNLSFLSCLSLEEHHKDCHLQRMDHTSSSRDFLNHVETILQL